MVDSCDGANEVLGLVGSIACRYVDMGPSEVERGVLVKSAMLPLIPELNQIIGRMGSDAKLVDIPCMYTHPFHSLL